MDPDLHQIVAKLVSGDFELVEVGSPGFFFVRTVDWEILLFTKKVPMSIEDYNASISKHTFGQELIHMDDYKLVQFKLDELGIDECLYVVYSREDEMWYDEPSIFVNPTYIAYCSEEAH